MTKPIDPYSRVYWRVLDDERFTEIRGDVRHFGSWALMLLVADMAYPAPAFVPPTIPKVSLTKLADCGLIEVLPGGLFRLHGLKAERERRSPVGPGAAPDGLPVGSEAVPRRTLTRERARGDETRRDETRVDETSTDTARAGLPNLDHEAIRLLERVTGRPWSLAGDKQLGEFDRLVEDHGLAAVAGAFDAVANGQTLTARQLVWPAMKLLEPMPTTPDNREADLDLEAKARDRKRQEKVWATRLEWFRNTGKWDEAWGDPPAASA